MPLKGTEEKVQLKGGSQMPWHNNLIKVGREGVTFKWPAAVVIAGILYGGQYVGLSYQSRAERSQIDARNAEQDKKIASMQEQLARCVAVQQFLVDEVTDLQDKLNRQKVAPNVTRIVPQAPGGP